MEVAAWTAAAVVAVAVARWLGKAWQAAQGSTGDAKLPRLPTPQRRLPPPRYGERITVLSIDGGGIRGLIPTVVLASLEEELKRMEDDGEQDDARNDDPRIADYFDVIAGTSTGALIAAMLVTPKDEKTERPRTAEEIRDLYRELSPMIFPPMRSQILGPPLIGTGSLKKEETEMYSAKECGEWSACQWGFKFRPGRRSPIVDVFTQASNFLVDYNVAMLFHSHGCEKNYLRIQLMVNPSENTLSMDDATPGNMDKLEAFGENLLNTALARVSKSTGMYMTVDAEPDGGVPKNEKALKDFAKILYNERRDRIRIMRERQDAPQA